ncbi:MAG: hypothetical protein FGM58_03075 [Acidimicrobiia bacterium]|nr:hypothetical protein [Acidimicrobiia bacterium]
MPVQESRRRTSRSLVLAVAGVAVGIMLVLGLFVIAIPSLTESGTIEVQLGSDTYDAGGAASRSENIRDGGPLLFSDVSSGNRDIYLQHIGDDIQTGWYAFDARRVGQSRNCTLVWQPAESTFRDPCDDTVVPADGAGQPTYPVTITDKGKVVIDLTPDEPPTGSR